MFLNSYFAAYFNLCGPENFCLPGPNIDYLIILIKIFDYKSSDFCILRKGLKIPKKLNGFRF